MLLRVAIERSSIYALILSLVIYIVEVSIGFGSPGVPWRSSLLSWLVRSAGFSGDRPFRFGPPRYSLAIVPPSRGFGSQSSDDRPTGSDRPGFPGDRSTGSDRPGFPGDRSFPPHIRDGFDLRFFCRAGVKFCFGVHSYR